MATTYNLTKADLTRAIAGMQGMLDFLTRDDVQSRLTLGAVKGSTITTYREQLSALRERIACVAAERDKLTDPCYWWQVNIPTKDQYFIYCDNPLPLVVGEMLASLNPALRLAVADKLTISLRSNKEDFVIEFPFELWRNSGRETTVRVEVVLSYNPPPAGNAAYDGRVANGPSASGQDVEFARKIIKGLYEFVAVDRPAQVAYSTIRPDETEAEESL